MNFTVSEIYIVYGTDSKEWFVSPTIMKIFSKKHMYKDRVQSSD